MLAIRVQIFASHPVATAQFRKVLAAERDLHLALKEECFDVGLFDGELPRLEAALTMTRLSCPSMRPLLLSNPCDEDECLRWMFRGVRGMISYDRYERDLVRAVRTLAHGQLYFPSQVVSRWKQIDCRFRTAVRCLPLTRRELEVAGLLSRRLSNKQVGAILGLTERTVKFHVGNILTKLGLRSRYELYAASPEPAGMALPTAPRQPASGYLR